MPLTIKARGDIPYYDLQAVLDDVTYTIELKWNVRLGAWFMNVLDGQGVGLFQGGLRLVANWPLAAYTTGRTPPGAFFLFDTSGQEEDPGMADLGVRHKLLYYTASELAGA